MILMLSININFNFTQIGAAKVNNIFFAGRRASEEQKLWTIFNVRGSAKKCFSEFFNKQKMF